MHALNLNLSWFPPTVGALFRRLLYGLLFLTLARVIFWAFNAGQFAWPGALNAFEVLFWGFYFDIISLFYCLAPFILIHLVASNWFYRVWVQKFLKWFFTIILCVLLTLTFIDAGYYPFSKSRLTMELFNMAAGESASISQYILDYWFFVPIILVLTYLLFRFYPTIKNTTPLRWYIQVPASILVLGLLVLTIRGGLRLKPLRSIDTALFVEASHAQLAVSTGFNLLESMQVETLRVPEYFKLEELHKQMRSDYVVPAPGATFKPKNVVIIILESFGKEYSFPKPGTAQSYTPFLQELAKKSLFYNNAYSNGTRSVDAIPAILEGVPKLTKTDFMYSNYIRNHTPGFPNYLTDKGYSCLFFHGGKNGTLGFEAFLKSHGWQYFGKDQYAGKEADFDGQWGIFDGPYLQSVANKLNTVKSPFVASIFTLSSHHPYTLPALYRDSFKTVKQPIHKTIRYTDNCLRQFFETVKNEAWYKETIFVITADHSSENFSKYYQTDFGRFELPLMVFEPANELASENNEVIQHIDIIPLVLQKLGYNDTIFTMGTYFSKPEEKAAFQNLDGMFQLIQPKLTIKFDGQKVVSGYDVISGKPSADAVSALPSLRFLQFKIQDYYYRMVNNKFY